MEKIKEKMGMGGKEHTHVHDAENMPRQYETHTETVEKIPQMRAEQRTEHVPRMHERQEEVMVPKHKIVMEKETRTVPEMRHEPVQRDVQVPSGEYRERVVDHNRHPGTDTGAGSALEHKTDRDLRTDTYPHEEQKSTMQKIKEKVMPKK